MHLLICDDDARFAARVEQKVRDELAQRGIPAQITVCTRGEEALATPHLELYQVALLDVDLDTMNGISLGRQLRQSQAALSRASSAACSTSKVACARSSGEAVVSALAKALRAASSPAARPCSWSGSC